MRPLPITSIATSNLNSNLSYSQSYWRFARCMMTLSDYHEFKTNKWIKWYIVTNLSFGTGSTHRFHSHPDIPSSVSQHTHVGTRSQYDWVFLKICSHQNDTRHTRGQNQCFMTILIWSVTPCRLVCRRALTFRRNILSQSSGPWDFFFCNTVFSYTELYYALLFLMLLLRK